jgi:hypothetical protein
MKLSLFIYLFIITYLMKLAIHMDEMWPYWLMNLIL